MRIEQVEVLPFEIPLVRPLETARGPVEVRRGWIVRVRGRNGHVGLGEAAPHPHAAGEAVAREAEGLQGTASALWGVDAGRVDEIVASLARGPAWIACGIDTALRDLLARSRGIPLHDLLGGAQRGRVPVNALLDARGLAGCIEQAGAAVAAGFTHAKRKATEDADTTVAEVVALAAAVPGLAVRIDANGVWSRRVAHDVLRRLDGLGPTLEWVEQPLGPQDVLGLAALRRESRVAIAADESVRGAGDVERLARHGACDAIVVKLAQVGGLGPAYGAVQAAAAAGLDVAVTTGIDTGVGLAAALSLAVAAPGRLSACGLATGPLLSGDVVRAPILPAPSMAAPPGPGLGVELDEAALARFAGGSR